MYLSSITCEGLLLMEEILHRARRHLILSLRKFHSRPLEHTQKVPQNTNMIHDFQTINRWWFGSGVCSRALLEFSEIILSYLSTFYIISCWILYVSHSEILETLKLSKGPHSLPILRYLNLRMYRPGSYIGTTPHPRMPVTTRMTLHF